MCRKKCLDACWVLQRPVMRLAVLAVARRLCLPAGFVPGALRIPRHMLLLRSESLNHEGSHIVAYGTNEAKSMQVAPHRPPRPASSPPCSASCSGGLRGSFMHVEGSISRT